jgi:L,D-peptidoglycan transpeptidase YkuD (ErfK/YbiS/YcfS/YnhG family)
MRAFAAFVALVGACLMTSGAFAQTCPAPIGSAQRLVLVTVPTLNSSGGSLRRFERAQTDATWHEVGSAQPVNVGKKGVAWGRAFRELAGDNEPVKIEGDKKSPAGIYPIGRPFGFGPSRLANYLQIDSDSVCVEDPSSPAYNTITSKKAVGVSVSKETMGASSLYRRGLATNYPTDRAHKSGSCIFLHVWRSPGSGTSGCVTMPEERVAILQQFVNGHPTVLALLPESALSRLADCLPAGTTARNDGH